ncbi:MAG: tetratricopeptide repeat protein, partial [Ignavibacteria bacterium]|nr:tetratricopeptide repeat protein [Ignavibacteria bacterium]
MRIRFTFWLLTLSISLCFLFQSKSLIADSPQIIDSLQKELIHANGFEKLKIYKELIKSLRNIDPAKGITVSKEAILLCDQIGNTRMKAEILNEEGVCYRKLNIPEKSLSLHLESLKIFEDLRDSTGIAFTLANIGNVYHIYKDLDKALDYHFRSLYLKEFLKDEPQIAYSQNAIGMVLADKEEYARAMDFYVSAMSIRKKNDQQLELANIYANIGKVMVKLNRYDDALDYLNQALAVYNITKNEYGEALVHNQIAELYAMKGDPDKAIIYLDKAEIIGLKIKNISVLHFNYKLRKNILKGQKKFEEALISAEKTTLYNDSLFSERRNYEMTEIQVRYETQQLDAENEILRLNLKEEEL